MLYLSTTVWLPFALIAPYRYHDECGRIGRVFWIDLIYPIDGTACSVLTPQTLPS